MKGIILTLDSIMAFIIMTIIISLLIFFRIEITSPFLTAQQLHATSEDVLTIFSESELREVVNQSLLDDYKQKGILNESDFNKKTIDVIGTLWSAGNVSEAANITKDILEKFLPSNIGYQLLIDDDNVYNSSDTTRPAYENAATEISSARIASGYQKYNKSSGYVARAWSKKITRNVTKIISINLEWGGYGTSGLTQQDYWSNGWAPASESKKEAVLKKNFTIPTDATIFSAFIQLSLNSQNTRVIVNGYNPPVYEGTDGIYERDITSRVKTGLNNLEIAFNNTANDLAHFHPGTYIKIKYNTSEVESGSNKTVFNADWIRGAPAASEIIPFFVNAPIKNVTAFVEVQNINAFLLLTLNYKYNISNPLQNVILYKNLTGINCNGFSSQSSCQAHPECSWNPNIANLTAFHATFDEWSTSSNCGNYDIEGWNECRLGEGTLYWRARAETGSYNSSSIRYHEGNDIDTNNATWITKCLDLSSYSKAYVTFWYNKTATGSGTNERQFILVNRTGAGTLVSLWGSTTSASPWTYQELNITNYISTYTCIRYMAGAASDPTNDKLRLDDFKIIGTASGSCVNIAGEDVKNRTYEIIFNQTGSLINEYNSTHLLNTSFNPNVTLKNIYENMTNTFGIYADIRAPVNDTIKDGSNTNDVDWQRLGMYAHNNTAGHGDDHYCFITGNSNVTVYHDLDQYGLEYGKIDITLIENFTDSTPPLYCISKNIQSCKDANLSLTFPFSTRIITAAVLGTQRLAGNDNGYNWAWIWYEGQQTEANITLDTDTPPGTITYLPVKFFGLNKINTIRVGDKDGSDRALSTEQTSLMGNRRSIVEYKFLIPSQVGYGKVFENQTRAVDEAVERLKTALGGYVVTSDVQTEAYSVSNVPYTWGPANIRMRVWT